MQYMALLFAEAHGVDIAPAMIEQARKFLARHPNAFPAVCDGARLDAYADGTFDFVYSYVVFQHIPDKEVIRSYVREARRVLRPRGVFKYLVKVEPWREGGHDSWHGVDVTRADVEAWNAECGFELVNAYSNVEPTTAWVVVRAI
jgi:ubiquinone/menaquinone biosynthesis C-methylase UbiE